MKRIRAAALLLALLLLPIPAASAADIPAGVSVGYYYGGFNTDPADLPIENLTHVIYAFAKIDPQTWKVTLRDPARDRENLRELRALREKRPDLKILLSVGGASNSTYFSDVASTAQRRETFAQSCRDLLREEKLDGLDINWEYPVSGGQSGVRHRTSDRENFTLLLRQLRSVLSDFCLTAAGGATKDYLDKIEPKKVSQVLDYIFLMGYDFWGPWEKRTGIHAPLEKVRAIAEAYLEAGIPSGKIILGTPLYGYRYTGVKRENSALNRPFSGGGSIPYDSVKKLLDSRVLRLYHYQNEPYLYSSGTLISYDNEDSIAAKAALAGDLGLAGVGFWELSYNAGGELIDSAVRAFAKQKFSTDAFTDVKPDSWYASAVGQAAGMGWLPGMSEGRFFPDAPLTLSALITALYRMEGEPSGGDTDLPEWDAAAWAVSVGIVSSREEGASETPVSRERLAAALWLCARHRNGSVSDSEEILENFQDGERVRPFARAAMAWAVNEGLLRGRARNLLDPQGGASRAEAAVVLIRFAKMWT